MRIPNNPNTSDLVSELATLSDDYGLNSLQSENGVQGATLIFFRVNYPPSINSLSAR